MLLTPPKPLRPWMRNRIREAKKAGSEIDILDTLTRFSREHRAFIDTEFQIETDVTVRQRDREIHFPRPLHAENHRSILLGYVESLHGKYQLEGFCEVEPGDTVIDCGAYVGGFARSVIEFAGRTVLIEPAPANYDCCVRNLDNFENAEIYQLGLFNMTGTLPLQMSRRCVDHSFLEPDHGATGERIDVPIMRLDNLATMLNLISIDFFKLEAEGAEIEAMEGMGNLRPTKISIDAGPERYGESPMEELTKMLDTRGYKTRTKGNTLLAVLR